MRKSILFTIKIFFHFFFFFCGACTSDQTDGTVESKKHDGILHAETIPIDKLILRPSKIIFMVPDRVLIYDNTSDSMFNLFSVENGALLQSWGQTGKGPEENLMVADETINYNNKTLTFLDNNNLVTYTEVNRDSLRYKSKKPVSSSPEPINGFVALSDSIFVKDNPDLQNSDPERELVLFSASNPSIQTFGRFPEANHEFANDMERIQYFMKKPTYNSVVDKLAYFYTFQPILKIFDTNGDLLKQVKYKIDQDKTNESSGKILYSVSPVSTSKHIYSLYLGDSKENVFNPDANFLPELLVWNWEGELVQRYQLDKLIGAFTVDEVTNAMYATSLNGGQFIYKFQLEPEDMGVGKTTFENDFYRFQLPKGYQLIPGIEKSNVSKLTTSRSNQNVVHNYNMFYKPDRKETDECKCTLGIVMQLSKNPDQLKRMLNRTTQNSTLISDTIDIIDKNQCKPIYLRKYNYSDRDPRGDISYVKNASYYWADNDSTVFEIYTVCENDTYCIEALDDVLNSFVVKN